MNCAHGPDVTCHLCNLSSKTVTMRDRLDRVRARAHSLSAITCAGCTEWTHPLCWIASELDAVLAGLPDETSGDEPMSFNALVESHQQLKKQHDDACEMVRIATDEHPLECDCEACYWIGRFVPEHERGDVKTKQALDEMVATSEAIGGYDLAEKMGSPRKCDCGCGRTEPEPPQKTTTPQGFEIQCEACKLTAIMPYTDETRQQVSIEHAAGWMLYPRRLCPKHSAGNGKG